MLKINMDYVCKKKFNIFIFRSSAFSPVEFDNDFMHYLYYMRYYRYVMGSFAMDQPFWIYCMQVKGWCSIGDLKKKFPGIHSVYSVGDVEAGKRGVNIYSSGCNIREEGAYVGYDGPFESGVVKEKARSIRIVFGGKKKI